MPLKENQLSKILDWFNSKIGKMYCPVCKSVFPETLTLDSTQAVFLNYDKNQILLDQGLPAVSIVCPNCAYVMHFSSLKIGI